MTVNEDNKFIFSRTLETLRTLTDIDRFLMDFEWTLKDFEWILKTLTGHFIFWEPPTYRKNFVISRVRSGSLAKNPVVVKDNLANDRGHSPAG